MNKIDKDLSMFERFCKRVFTLIGDIAITGSDHPMWVIYSPKPHKFKGQEYYNFIKKSLADPEFLQPGDILLRCYDQYLDSYLIPGDLNHGGIYIGDHKGISDRVVHSISDGVVMEALTDFIRTDHFVVVRPNGVNVSDQQRVVNEVLKYYDEKWAYDFSFRYGNDIRLYCTELVGRAWAVAKSKFKFKMVNHYGREGLSADSIFLSDVDIVFMTESIKKFSVYQQRLDQQAE